MTDHRSRHVHYPSVRFNVCHEHSDTVLVNSVAASRHKYSSQLRNKIIEKLLDLVFVKKVQSICRFC